MYKLLYSQQTEILGRREKESKRRENHQTLSPLFFFSMY